jgi:hypothetical protein
LQSFEDLDDLREVLTAVRDRRSEVVSAWYELYQLHFGDRRALSELEFCAIFEPALLVNQEYLLRKDMDGYPIVCSTRQLVLFQSWPILPSVASYWRTCSSPNKL